MSNRFSADHDDVIVLEEAGQHLINHRTFTVGEFLAQLAGRIHTQTAEKAKWIGDGLACQKLAPGQNWQSGKVRVCLEFIPDEPESPLDEIRREIQEQ